MTEKSCWY